MTLSTDKEQIGSALPPRPPSTMTLPEARKQGYRYQRIKKNVIKLTKIDSSFEEELSVYLSPVWGEDKWVVFVKFTEGRVDKTIILGCIHKDDLAVLRVGSPRELDLADVRGWKVSKRRK